jgi:hypothetical protein
MPARVQSRRRRQHVTPLTPKTSVGSSVYAIPLRSMNISARRHNRSSAGGRPPLGRGPRGGSNGLNSSQSSSGSSSTAIASPPCDQGMWHCHRQTPGF